MATENSFFDLDPRDAVGMARALTELPEEELTPELKRFRNSEVWAAMREGMEASRKSRAELAGRGGDRTMVESSDVGLVDRLERTLNQFQAGRSLARSTTEYVGGFNRFQRANEMLDLFESVSSSPENKKKLDEQLSGEDRGILSAFGAAQAGVGFGRPLQQNVELDGKTIPRDEALGLKVLMDRMEQGDLSVVDERNAYLDELDSALKDSFRALMEGTAQMPVEVKELRDAMENDDVGALLRSPGALADAFGMSSYISSMGMLLAIGGQAAGTIGTGGNPLYGRVVGAGLQGAWMEHHEYSGTFFEKVLDKMSEEGVSAFDAREVIKWSAENQDFLSQAHRDASERAAVVAGGEAGGSLILGAAGPLLSGLKVTQRLMQNGRIAKLATGRTGKTLGFAADTASQAAIAGGAERLGQIVGDQELSDAEVAIEAAMDVLMTPVQRPAAMALDRYKTRRARAAARQQLDEDTRNLIDQREGVGDLESRTREPAATLDLDALEQELLDLNIEERDFLPGQENTPQKQTFSLSDQFRPTNVDPWQQAADGADDEQALRDEDAGDEFVDGETSRYKIPRDEEGNVVRDEEGNIDFPKFTTGWRIQRLGADPEVYARESVKGPFREVEQLEGSVRGRSWSIRENEEGQLVLTGTFRGGGKLYQDNTVTGTKKELRQKFNELKAAEAYENRLREETEAVFDENEYISKISDLVSSRANQALSSRTDKAFVNLSPRIIRYNPESGQVIGYAMYGKEGFKRPSLFEINIFGESEEASLIQDPKVARRMAKKLPGVPDEVGQSRKVREVMNRDATKAIRTAVAEALSLSPERLRRGEGRGAQFVPAMPGNKEFQERFSVPVEAARIMAVRSPTIKMAQEAGFNSVEEYVDSLARETVEARRLRTRNLSSQSRDLLKVRRALDTLKTLREERQAAVEGRPAIGPKGMEALDQEVAAIEDALLRVELAGEQGAMSATEVRKTLEEGNELLEQTKALRESRPLKEIDKEIARTEQSIQTAGGREILETDRPEYKRSPADELLPVDPLDAENVPGQPRAIRSVMGSEDIKTLKDAAKGKPLSGSIADGNELWEVELTTGQQITGDNRIRNLRVWFNAEDGKFHAEIDQIDAESLDEARQLGPINLELPKSVVKKMRQQVEGDPSHASIESRASVRDQIRFDLLRSAQRQEEVARKREEASVAEQATRDAVFALEEGVPPSDIGRVPLSERATGSLGRKNKRDARAVKAYYDLLNSLEAAYASARDRDDTEAMAEIDADRTYLISPAGKEEFYESRGQSGGEKKNAAGVFAEEQDQKAFDAVLEATGVETELPGGTVEQQRVSREVEKDIRNTLNSILNDTWEQYVISRIRNGEREITPTQFKRIVNERFREAYPEGEPIPARGLPARLDREKQAERTALIRKYEERFIEQAAAEVAAWNQNPNRNRIERPPGPWTRKQVQQMADRVMFHKYASPAQKKAAEKSGKMEMDPQLFLGRAPSLEEVFGQEGMSEALLRTFLGPSGQLKPEVYNTFLSGRDFNEGKGKPLSLSEAIRQEKASARDAREEDSILQAELEQAATREERESARLDSELSEELRRLQEPTRPEAPILPEETYRDERFGGDSILESRKRGREFLKKWKDRRDAIEKAEAELSKNVAKDEFEEMEQLQQERYRAWLWEEGFSEDVEIRQEQKDAWDALVAISQGDQVNMKFWVKDGKTNKAKLTELNLLLDVIAYETEDGTLRARDSFRELLFEKFRGSSREQKQAQSVFRLVSRAMEAYDGVIIDSVEEVLEGESTVVEAPALPAPAEADGLTVTFPTSFDTKVKAVFDNKMAYRGPGINTKDPARMPEWIESLVAAEFASPGKMKFGQKNDWFDPVVAAEKDQLSAEIEALIGAGADPLRGLKGSDPSRYVKDARYKSSGLLARLFKSNENLLGMDFSDSVEGMQSVQPAAARHVGDMEREIGKFYLEARQAGFDVDSELFDTTVNALLQGSGPAYVIDMLGKPFTSAMDTALNKVKAHIQNLSTDLGRIEITPDNVKAAIEENKGLYLHRSADAGKYLMAGKGLLASIRRGWSKAGERDKVIKFIGETNYKALSRMYQDMMGLPSTAKELADQKAWKKVIDVLVDKSRARQLMVKDPETGRRKMGFFDREGKVHLMDSYNDQAYRTKDNLQALYEYVEDNYDRLGLASSDTYVLDQFRAVVGDDAFAPYRQDTPGTHSEFKRLGLMRSPRLQILDFIHTLVSKDDKPKQGMFSSLRAAYPEREARKARASEITAWLVANKERLSERGRDQALEEIQSQFPELKRAVTRGKEALAYADLFRESLREITDPTFLVTDTVQRLAVMKHMMDSVPAFVQTGLNNGSIKVIKGTDVPRGYERLVESDNPMAGWMLPEGTYRDFPNQIPKDMTELYASKDVRQVFRALTGAEAMDSRLRWAAAAQGYGKYNLVILNPEGQLRNFASTALMGMRTGALYTPGNPMFSTKAVGRLGRISGSAVMQRARPASAPELDTITTNIVRALYNRRIFGDAARLGALRDVIKRVRSGELTEEQFFQDQNQIGEILRQYAEERLGRPVKDIGKLREWAESGGDAATRWSAKVASVMEETFRLGDELVKAQKWMSWNRAFSDLLGVDPNLLEEYFAGPFDSDGNYVGDVQAVKDNLPALLKAMDNSAKMVRDVLPTFSNNPRIVRAMNRSLILGAFAGFPAEVARNNFKQAVIAKRLMQGELPDGTFLEDTSSRVKAAAWGAQLGTAQVLFGVGLPEAVASFRGSILYPGAAVVAAMFAGGEDDEDRDALHEAAPASDIDRKGVQFYYQDTDITRVSNIDEDGNFSFVVLPHTAGEGIIRNAARKFANGFMDPLRQHQVEMSRGGNPSDIATYLHAISKGTAAMLTEFGFRDEVIPSTFIRELQSQNIRDLELDQAEDWYDNSIRDYARGGMRVAQNIVGLVAPDEMAATQRLGAAAVSTGIALGPFMQTLESMRKIAGASMEGKWDQVAATAVGIRMEYRNIRDLAEDNQRDFFIMRGALRTMKDIVTDVELVGKPEEQAMQYAAAELILQDSLEAIAGRTEFMRAKGATAEQMEEFFLASHPYNEDMDAIVGRDRENWEGFPAAFLHEGLVEVPEPWDLAVDQLWGESLPAEITEEQRMLLQQQAGSMRRDVQYQPIPTRSGEEEPEELSPIEQELQGLQQTPEQEDVKELEQLKQDEGFRDQTYLDTEGIPTVGYGTNLEVPENRRMLEELGYEIDGAGRLNRPLEEADAAKLLEAGLSDALDDVAALFPGIEDPEVVSILSNMAYNLGRSRLGEFRDLRAALVGGEGPDFNAAADAMIDSRWYNQVGGRSRRLVERMRNLA